MSPESLAIWAITGHRQIPSRTALLDAMLRHGEILLRTHKHVRGLTPLAEGADRIFAEALSQLAIPYQVPLPLSQANYAKDFPASLDEFHRHLAKAERVFTLPRCPWLTEEDVIEQGNGRDMQYLSAGVYLVNQCDVLFSAWDGRPPRGLGGTAQITALFQDFTSLKTWVTAEQYHYFLRLGQRDTAHDRTLISLDMV
ncbi:hypothetical protein ACL2XP_25620 [Sodalis sp. RH21]|uniref:hypothetical protein n=1 Tax=unclassified Sodalis (in: enterobacteria) TaxID=2636512 RepID=UPI0039B59392